MDHDFNYWTLIQERTVGHEIKAISIGALKEHHSTKNKRHVPAEKQGKPLSVDEAMVCLNYKVRNEYGGADAHPVYIWTDKAVFFTVEYDGKIHLASVPNAPVKCKPVYKGNWGEDEEEPLIDGTVYNLNFERYRMEADISRVEEVNLGESPKEFDYDSDSDFEEYNDGPRYYREFTVPGPEKPAGTVVWIFGIYNDNTGPESFSPPAKLNSSKVFDNKEELLQLLNNDELVDSKLAIEFRRRLYNHYSELSLKNENFKEYYQTRISILVEQHSVTTRSQKSGSCSFYLHKVSLPSQSDEDENQARLNREAHEEDVNEAHLRGLYEEGSPEWDAREEYFADYQSYMTSDVQLRDENHGNDSGQQIDRVEAILAMTKQ